jgi:hypothetical protein
MSTVLEIEQPIPIDRVLLEVGVPDLRWVVEPPWPLPEGAWYVYRDRISTRTTKIERQSARLQVTIAAGACDEDRRLALAIVRRTAPAGATVIADLFGDVTLDELDAYLDETWNAAQLASAARVAIHLAREQGFVDMPGPTRDVRVGPRVVAELEAIDESERGERLQAIMRRVLWPDPRYESAALFRTTSPGGKDKRFAILLPERACILPACDCLALEDEAGPFLIPRAALDALPVSAAYLDDGNQLVERIAASEWSTLCREARARAVPPA